VELTWRGLRYRWIAIFFGRFKIPRASAIIIEAASTLSRRLQRSYTLSLQVQFQRGAGIGDRHRFDQFKKSGLAAVGDLSESCPKRLEPLRTRNRFFGSPDFTNRPARSIHPDRPIISAVNEGRRPFATQKLFFSLVNFSKPTIDADVLSLLLGAGGRLGRAGRCVNRLSYWQL
jgi:hypothetical protein